ncbi:hypothetical protein [Methylocystis sp. SC2]|uniref:hypothetical protein n=1 Tax=Methylocystis sp. (strain SC2) TaxID=187303 RepID=UPI00027AF508|nr:hypothetical protein [Methylocystis sp. SC2]CCJ08468.1 Conserved hypothetical protein [Methylocystis sp. SC2]
MAEGKTTVDHDAIRKWVESRGGSPSRVKGTGGKSDAGLLRVDFGPAEEGLEKISWTEFFETFERNKLAFLYQDEDDSRFNKLIRRDGK